MVSALLVAPAALIGGVISAPAPWTPGRVSLVICSGDGCPVALISPAGMPWPSGLSPAVMGCPGSQRVPWRPLAAEGSPGGPATVISLRVICPAPFGRDASRRPLDSRQGVPDPPGGPGPVIGGPGSP
jgi:hypothetical protein